MIGLWEQIGRESVAAVQQIAASANDTEEIRRARRHSEAGAVVPGRACACVVTTFSSSSLNSFFSVALSAVTEKAGSSFLAAILVKREPTLDTFFN